MAKMKGKRVWIRGDVLNYLWLHAESDDEDINSIIRKILDVPEPGLDRKKVFENSNYVRRKYDVSDLAVGEHKIFPLEIGPDGNPKKLRSMKQSIQNYMKKMGKMFHMTNTADGLMVYRAL